jgi:glycosyltransferase involved in cell wall biosynthesis
VQLAAGVMNPTLVSVVMPVYDGQPFLGEAIESILRQSHGHLELIVVDDGSRDGSPDIIREFERRDRRVRPLFLEHRGAAAATNAGVAVARGEWLARVDQDDVSLDDRFEAQLAWAGAHAVAVCGGQIELTGDAAGQWWFPESHEAIRSELLFRPSLMQPTMLARTEIVRANPYAEGTSWDDYELLTRLVPRYRLASMARPLVRYRCHPGQTHLTERVGLRKDFRRYRFRYFYTLFPDTPIEHYLPLARASDRLPMRTLADLERAGRWLVDLAAPPEPGLKRRMRQRWLEVWQRSSELGAPAEAVYHDVLARIA